MLSSDCSSALCQLSQTPSSLLFLLPLPFPQFAVVPFGFPAFCLLLLLEEGCLKKGIQVEKVPAWSCITERAPWAAV